jgi:hypothetical protein
VSHIRNLNPEFDSSDDDESDALVDYSSDPSVCALADSPSDPLDLGTPMEGSEPTAVVHQLDGAPTITCLLEQWEAFILSGEGTTDLSHAECSLPLPHMQCSVPFGFPTQVPLYTIEIVCPELLMPSV